ncbi:MAG TPA: hypothetical protein VFY71_11185 [Planctomycetota bacterium]|nr:hypothetical protein [Planctomycetota bacterium]
MRNHFIMAMALAMVLAAPAGAQTLDQVRQAVADYFAEGAAAQESHDDLKGWGNAALPFLRDIAGKPDEAGAFNRSAPVRPGDWAILCSIEKIDTPEAIELLIEILDGKTAVSRSEVLCSLLAATYSHTALLRENVRFEQLVFKVAHDDSGTWSSGSRAVAASIMGRMGWEDGGPLLELMLHDDDLSVRKNAAEALSTLIGRHVDVRKPELSFPHATESADLSLLAELPNSDICGRIDTWFDGKAAVILSQGRQLTALAPPGTPARNAGFAMSIDDILSLPRKDGGMRWILLAPADRPLMLQDDLAICVDWELSEVWRYVPRDQGIESQCRLYDATGCTGVAFGTAGDEGVVAFDTEGRELFRVPHARVFNELASNPRVPDRWLHCSGQLLVFDNGGHLVRGPATVGQPSGGFLRATHAVLAQGRDGPKILAAGSDIRSNPTIVCCGLDDLHEAWRACVPDAITGLAMLEPPTGEQRVVATTEGDQLLVFDLDGGLHQQLLLPPDARDPAIRRYGFPVNPMSAGALPGGSYGLSIGVRANTVVYGMQ